MKNITKTLLILTFSFPIYFYGQTKTTEIVFYNSKCDSCKIDLLNIDMTRVDFDAQYFNLKYSIVEINLDKAIRNNDKRVISISGVGILYPGLETDNSKLKEVYKKYLNKYGHKTIWGTSDVINPSKPNIQSVAYEYAKKYNILLFKRMEIK